MYRKSNSFEVEDLRIKLNRMRRHGNENSEAHSVNNSNYKCQKTYTNDQNNETKTFVRKFKPNHTSGTGTRYQYVLQNDNESFSRNENNKKQANNNKDVQIKTEIRQDKLLNIKIELEAETGKKVFSMDKSDTLSIKPKKSEKENILKRQQSSPLLKDGTNEKQNTCFQRENITRKSDGATGSKSVQNAATWNNIGISRGPYRGGYNNTNTRGGYRGRGRGAFVNNRVNNGESHSRREVFEKKLE